MFLISTNIGTTNSNDNIKWFMLKQQKLFLYTENDYIGIYNMWRKCVF